MSRSRAGKLHCEGAESKCCLASCFAPGTLCRFTEDLWNEFYLLPLDSKILEVKIRHRHLLPLNSLFLTIGVGLIPVDSHIYQEEAGARAIPNQSHTHAKKKKKLKKDQEMQKLENLCYSVQLRGFIHLEEVSLTSDVREIKELSPSWPLCPCPAETASGCCMERQQSVPFTAGEPSAAGQEEVPLGILFRGSSWYFIPSPKGHPVTTSL